MHSGIWELVPITVLHKACVSPSKTDQYMILKVSMLDVFQEVTVVVNMKVWVSVCVYV